MNFLSLGRADERYDLSAATKGVMRLIAGFSIVKFRFRFPHQFPEFDHFGVAWQP